VGSRNLEMGVRFAAIFPGQGSQVVGMGTDVAAKSPAARELFERAQSVLGYDLLDLQARGPETQLRETQYSQPAIYVTNLALYYAAATPDAVVSAGHSFGEFCSLTIARSLSFEEALRMVDARGKAMQHAAELKPGGMTAVLGLDVAQIREVVNQTNAANAGNVQLANFNSPGQIVISGDAAAVDAAAAEMLSRGAKRVVPLNVSGAWHSRLMDPAVSRFAPAVEAGHFELPAFDVVSNVDAQPYRDVQTIRRNLVRSITEEVRWHDTAEKLLSYELDAVVEFGATPVLGPLMKRLPNAPAVLNVTDFAGIERLREKIGVNA
jgi:[acyl-carrier-protein] S-malonyltransferase